MYCRYLLILLISPYKALWAIAGASHQNFHQYARAEYEKRILSFFKTHLKNAI